MTWENAGTIPDRLIAKVEGLSVRDARFLAREALTVAQRLAPKVSGHMARQSIQPIWGEGFFGIRWNDPYVWFQEAGIRPFTMHKLAGKTIPMWIDDPTGEERANNPKAQTRTTLDGRHQVLIFRKVAQHGERKTVVRDGQEVDVPASYPGAPGRISLREPRRPWTAPGKVGGRIARHNVGVRWRHPGLSRRSFIRTSLTYVSSYHGFALDSIRDQYGRWR